MSFYMWPMETLNWAFGLPPLTEHERENFAQVIEEMKQRYTSTLN